MAKAKKAYLCSECGAYSVKWQGQCPDCGAWNTLEESRIASAAPAAEGALAAQPLGDVAEESGFRHPTGFGEFDRVLGGGLVAGSVVLLGGDPGVGKSTLLQQVAARLPGELNALYATGEESLRQVAQRSHRISMENPDLQLLADTSLENILDQARRVSSQVVIIDSIQTIVSDGVQSAPGSVSQLRECVGQIVRFAKARDVAILIIGHVTKEGAIAGPRVVEHMVDTVLYFESDPASRYTLVRAVKNRFGASSELGVLAMTESGFREVKNPSAIFLSGAQAARAGSVITVAWEGSRPLLVEVQALVADGAGNYSRHVAQGVEQGRLSLLAAVLQRHGGVAIGGDIFVNVTGGLRISETAADLPILLSIISSFRDQPVAEGLISFGEVGLAGEVRPVKFGTERLAEAAKQGFKRAIVARGNLPRRSPAGMEVIAVEELREALDQAF